MISRHKNQPENVKLYCRSPFRPTAGIPNACNH